MFKSAQLEHVHILHSIGRQLAVLKRMYEGYNLIIERVINGPRQDSRSGYTKSEPATATSIKYGPVEGYGVAISSAAALRFERLQDRITLYALSEINSCLEEKESLMTMVRHIL
jgi:hypothetical protein